MHTVRMRSDFNIPFVKVGNSEGAFDPDDLFRDIFVTSFYCCQLLRVDRLIIIIIGPFSQLKAEAPLHQRPARSPLLGETTRRRRCSHPTVAVALVLVHRAFCKRDIKLA